MVILIVIGCSKNKGGNDDKTAPVVEVTTPVNDQSFAAGATVNITGQITDNDQIYMVHTHISDNNTGELLIDIHRYPGSATYSVSESFTVAAGRTYKVTVVARDRNANETSVTRIIRGN